MNAIDRFFKIKLSNTKAYALYFLAAALFVTPFIIANVQYADDIVRNALGIYNWTAVGRPLAEFVMSLLSMSFGDKHPNVGVLTYLLAIPTLTYSGYYTATRLFPDKLQLKKAVIFVPIVVNPFLIGNLVYQYDAFFMVLAYTLVVVGAVYLYTQQACLSVYITTTILLVASCMLYQPMVSVFIAMMGLLVCVDIWQKTNIVTIYKKILVASWVFAVSIIISYTITSLLPGLESSRAALVSLNGDGAAAIVDNTMRSLGLIKTYLLEYAVLTVPLAIVAAVGYVFLLRTATRGVSARDGVAATILLVAVPPLLLVLALGPQLLLNDVFIGQRMLPIVGVWLALLCFTASIAIDRLPKLASVVAMLGVGLVTMQGVTYSSVVATQLSSTQTYARQEMQLVSEALNKLNPHNDKVVLMGAVGTPKSVHYVIESHPSLEAIITSVRGWTGRFILKEMNHNIRANMGPLYKEGKLICEKKIPSLMATQRFEIYQYEGLKFVFLKSGHNDTMCR